MELDKSDLLMQVTNFTSFSYFYFYYYGKTAGVWLAKR